MINRLSQIKKNALAIKIFILLLIFIMAIEIFILIPSLLMRHDNWLREQSLLAGQALIVIETDLERPVEEAVARQILKNAMAYEVSLWNEERMLAILESEKSGLPEKMVRFYLDDIGIFERSAHTARLIWNNPSRAIELISPAENMFPALVSNAYIRVMLNEMDLARELRQYMVRILGLSLIIAIFAGALLNLSLFFILVRPIKKIAIELKSFSPDTDGRNFFRPRQTIKRNDEIGVLAMAVHDMKRKVRAAFYQQRRLAILGEAVAKINHDMRNMMATIDLLSTGLERSQDSRVTKTVPKLKKSVERVEQLADDILQYGKMTVATDSQDGARLCQVLDEVISDLENPSSSNVISVDHTDAVTDRDNVVMREDHCYRVFLNLLQNARQICLSPNVDDPFVKISVGFGGTDQFIHVDIINNGPIIPDEKVETLFEPFSFSTTKGGTGLGLAIAKELCLTNGGDLTLVRSSSGLTHFAVELRRRS